MLSNEFKNDKNLMIPLNLRLNRLNLDCFNKESPDAKPNAAHHPTPGQQDTFHLQVPSLAHDL
jgi:hypothetical protein